MVNLTYQSSPGLELGSKSRRVTDKFSVSKPRQLVALKLRAWPRAARIGPPCATAIMSLPVYWFVSLLITSVTLIVRSI